ncbi:ATP-dependent helicase [bacterium]|nr:ATP-dependent helicase [bacterium]
MSINLNSKQSNSIDELGAPILLTGGPGTGKTVTLSTLISKGLEKGIYKSHQVLGFTANPKATGPLKQSLKKMGTKDSHYEVYPISLFCLNFLKENQSLINRTIKTLISNEHQFTIIDAILSQENISNQTHSVLEYLRNFKQKTPSITELEALLPKGTLTAISKYESYMKEHHLIDIDDIPHLTLKILESTKVKVDHYTDYFMFLENIEDSNRAYIKIFNQLSKHAKQIILTADNSQPTHSIDTNLVADLPTLFPGLKKKTLTRNFQASRYLVNALNDASLIKQKMTTKSPLGNAISYFQGFDEKEELDYIVNKINDLKKDHTYSFDDFLILYRHSSQKKSICSYLKSRNIPHTSTTDQRSYDAPEIATFIHLLRYTINHLDTTSQTALSDNIFCPPNISEQSTLSEAYVHLTPEFKRIFKDNLNASKLKIHTFIKTLNFKGPISEFLHRLSLFHIPFDINVGIKVCPLEDAKGYVEKVVLITGLEDGILPHFDANLCADTFNHERHLFYSGMACTRKYLFLTSACKRIIDGKEWFNDPSDFLTLIKDLAYFCTERSQLLGNRLRDPIPRFELIKLNTNSLQTKLNLTHLKQGITFNHPQFGSGKITGFVGNHTSRVALVSFIGSTKKITESYILDQILT